MKHNISDKEVLERKLKNEVEKGAVSEAQAEEILDEVEHLFKFEDRVEKHEESLLNYSDASDVKETSIQLAQDYDELKSEIESIHQKRKVIPDPVEKDLLGTKVAILVEHLYETFEKVDNETPISIYGTIAPNMWGSLKYTIDAAKMSNPAVSEDLDSIKGDMERKIKSAG